jgi:hypothetical protein
VMLTGTIEQEVLGRTFATESGSWTTDLVALALTGPLFGHTLTLNLDPTMTSGGTTSITPSDGNFVINSFFDVFVELSLDSVPPLQTTRGPIEAVAAASVPEPESLMMFVTCLIALGAARPIRRGSSQRHPTP